MAKFKRYDYSQSKPYLNFWMYVIMKKQISIRSIFICRGVLLLLLLAVIQLPPLLVMGPVIFYVFSVSSTTTAVLFAIWGVFISISDSFLKPLLMGRGVQIPMLVILIGAIGGMVLFGIIGLFVGAVVFSLGFTLLQVWLEKDEQTEPETMVPDPSPAGESDE